jgi:microsomal dipeptidase-like Zn-dependent dipeptidase
VLLAILVLVLVATVGFFTFAPAIVENSMNKVEPGPLPQVTDETRALHRSLAVADMHADSLMWKRDLLERSDRGMVDLPRLQDGNVALQVFSSVTKTPKGQNYDSNGDDTDNITLLTVAQLQPPRTWTSLLQRSLYHAQKLAGFAEDSDGRLRVIRTGDDVAQLLADRAAGEDVTGGLLSVEGLQDLEGDPANLDKLYDAGYRMAGFAHFFDNEVAGSMHGEEKGGLSDLGRTVLAEMEQRGMVVDIAHASHRAVREILAAATRPVVASHGGVQATCRVNRNLTDEEVRGVAATGGVVGIGYWDGAVCDTSAESVAEAIAHVRDLVGIDHVGLGSDFDGAVTTRWDASRLDVVTQALVDRGFSDEEIRAVMGGNVLRVLREGLEPRP